jgi:class 3 adenylate cyclase/YHS domain-containing protein
MQIGIPEDVVLQMLHVFADNLSRVADAANRLFHLYVHERFRAEGLSGAQLFAATQAMSDQVGGLVDPAVQYFFRKGWERAVREDFLLHLAEEMTAPADVPGQVVRAILFVDLSSFTPLTEAMGDAAAARVVDRFSDIVRDAAAGCQGQVVKQIGDEFMLVFGDGRSAASCGLAIQDQANAEPRFPALRIGAHVGSVLYREGDYLGTAVNTAARVAASATRHQFLVTEAVRGQLDDERIEVVAVGARSLKGLSEEVELFELRRPEPRRTRVVDPVCGMELDEASAEAHLVWQEQRLLFCSETCLRRFLQAPGRYEVPTTSA